MDRRQPRRPSRSRCARSRSCTRSRRSRRLRMFRHGYQSWSPTGVATLGVDVDPSTIADLELLQAGHHADQRRVPTGELRSELVTVLADAAGDADRPARLRRRPPSTTARSGCDATDRRPGRAAGRGLPRRRRARARRGAGPARRRRRRQRRRSRDMLATWATEVGAGRTAPATTAPYQVGWCSWYHYFHEVTEADPAGQPGARRRLAVRRVPARRRLPGRHRRLAAAPTTRSRPTLDAIAARSRPPVARPGIWIAPFLAARRLAPSPPSTPTGSPASRTTRTDEPAADLVQPGVGRRPTTASARPRHHQPRGARPPRGTAADARRRRLRLPQARLHVRPARRRRLPRPGPDARPAGAGRASTRSVAAPATDTFLLGCGVPLGPVDRRGRRHPHRPGRRARAGPSPDRQRDRARLPRRRSRRSATPTANTLTRAFHAPAALAQRPRLPHAAHRPHTDLSPAAVRTWARHRRRVRRHGAGVRRPRPARRDARALLDEVVALGREVDAEAAAGRPPRSPRPARPHRAHDPAGRWPHAARRPPRRHVHAEGRLSEPHAAGRRSRALAVVGIVGGGR